MDGRQHVIYLPPNSTSLLIVYLPTYNVLRETKNTKGNLANWKSRARNGVHWICTNKFVVHRTRDGSRQIRGQSERSFTIVSIY